ncbi:MAG: hypothetical protein KF911_06555 [Pseudomonadales bacterium]|nr:hypothetical protein [Pseudomonadales bacterium]
MLFDLLENCDVFRRHAAEGRIAFGINHVMVGPINKTLDLVVTRQSAGRSSNAGARFSELVAKYGIVLSELERDILAQLPDLRSESDRDISEVAIALEAKACMTEHSKSLPRLHAEVLATGYLAKRAQPNCITVSYSLVNAALDFVTPSGSGRVNRHAQPEDARKVVEMLGRAIPLARDIPNLGYDFIGVTVLNCRNDGSPVEVVYGEPAPARNNNIHYERMVMDLCSAYRARFDR